jgi:hypothetical protein
MLNHEAIRKAYPNAKTIDDGAGAFDKEGNPIVLDQSLVDAAAAEIAAEQAATAYQRQRQPEYPSLAELADALYWASTGDTTKLDAYYAACGVVKAKYPKPEVTP